jgi:GDPmannose 4,6-dehydratase
MLQLEKPDDFVIATNETHTVREFATIAFAELGINLEWKGKGIDEKGIDKQTGKTLVEVDKEYFRPTEVEMLIGDYSKAKRLLGWKPNVTFNELVKLMVKADWEKRDNQNSKTDDR